MNVDEILSRLHIERLNEMQQAAIRAFGGGMTSSCFRLRGRARRWRIFCLCFLFLKPGVKGVQAVVLVPSRELALQIDQVFRAMGTEYNVMSCYGGRPAMDEHRVMKNVNPAVIIGTPGRMNDHLQKANFDASAVRLLVIDEFDKCLEFGFQEEIASVMGQLPRIERRFLLSATDAEEIPRFTGLRRVRKLDFLRPEHVLSSRLHLYKVVSPVKDKLETLFRLLCCIGNESTLVFCNHRESVERVGEYLRKMKMYCEVFHGGMEQDERERALYKFRNGSCPVLVSTDLAARGLDIPEIKNVVHYHLPVSEDSFIHRNGRTARWENEGNAYVLAYQEEALPSYLPEDALEDYELPGSVSLPPLPEFVTLYIGKGKKDKINKVDIVGFLSKKYRLQKDEIGKVDVKERHAFVAIARRKAKQVLNLVQNEKIKGVKALIEVAK